MSEKITFILSLVECTCDEAKLHLYVLVCIDGEMEREKKEQNVITKVWPFPDDLNVRWFQFLIT